MNLNQRALFHKSQMLLPDFTMDLINKIVNNLLQLIVQNVKKKESKVMEWLRIQAAQKVME